MCDTGPLYAAYRYDQSAIHTGAPSGTRLLILHAGFHFKIVARGRNHASIKNAVETVIDAKNYAVIV